MPRQEAFGKEIRPILQVGTLRNWSFHHHPYQRLHRHHFFVDFSNAKWFSNLLTTQQMTITFCASFCPNFASMVLYFMLSKFGFCVNIFDRSCSKYHHSTYRVLSWFEQIYILVAMSLDLLLLLLGYVLIFEMLFISWYNHGQNCNIPPNAFDQLASLRLIFKKKLI